MPYIKEEVRKELEPELQALLLRMSRTTVDYETTLDGMIVYVITELVKATYSTRKYRNKFDDLASVIGLLESAKLEFYRRVVSPYEDSKIEENGDVFD